MTTRRLTGPERDLLRLAVRDAPDEFLMALQAMAKQRLHEQVGSSSTA